MTKKSALGQSHAFGYGSRGNLARVLFTSQLDHRLYRHCPSFLSRKMFV